MRCLAIVFLFFFISFILFVVYRSAVLCYNMRKEGYDSMLIDGHIHLENGPLSVAYVMRFVEAGVKKGLDVLQILDHTHRFIEFAPMYESLKKASHYQKEWFDKKQLQPLADYHRLIAEMKRMDLPLQLKWGLEVCYTPEAKPLLRDLLAAYPYDFIIGSIHSIDGLLYDMPFSKEILWEKQSTASIYRRYYEIMEDMIASDLFTQIGHPDQLKLFGYEPGYDLTATYERIAEAAFVHNVFMENNTGIHYRYHHPDIGTNSQFLSILKKHGVKIMTASDAHVPEHVGMLIREISES